MLEESRYPCALPLRQQCPRAIRRLSGRCRLADFGEENIKNRTNGGAHGYDNTAPEMAATFIANGPAFKKCGDPAFDNVDVYPLLMKLIGVPALPSDGSEKQRLQR
jgi:predicted AlkP superfamily pyrophosphatase or phosphodiesterase